MNYMERHLGYAWFVSLVLCTQCQILNVNKSVSEHDIYCNGTTGQVLAATEEITTKIISFPPQSNLNRSSATRGQPLRTEDQPLASQCHQYSDEYLSCEMWTIQSDLRITDILVVISDLRLSQCDLFYLVTDKPALLLRFDANQTSDLNLDLDPWHVRSESRVTLIWVRQSLPQGRGASRRGQAVFSFTAVPKSAVATSGANPVQTSEARERFVLIAAIIVSLVTVIATVISVARARGRHCFGCFRTFLHPRKWRGQDRRSVSREGQAATRREDLEGGTNYMNHLNSSSGGRTQEETIMLMELHTPRPAEGGESRESTNLETVEDNSLIPLSACHRGCYSPLLSSSAPPYPGNDDHNEQHVDTVTSDLMHSPPRPLYSPSQRHGSPTSATISSTAFTTATAISTTTATNSTIATSSSPLNLNTAPTVSIVGGRATVSIQYFRLPSSATLISRITPPTAGPLPTSRQSQTRHSSLPDLSGLLESPPPPYAETPPPSYSSLYPDIT